MKRLLFSLVCCFPLLLSPSISWSVELTGPNNETLSASDQYGPVQSKETLWSISSILRPDSSVTVQQTLVAIYKTNPFAFYKGNINSIIPESMLNVPSLEFIAQQTNQEAMDLIRKYNPKKKKVVKKETPEVVKKKVETIVIEKVDPAITIENEANKEKLLAADSKLSALEVEMQRLNEQFIVATEETQVLKLKLQPLNDQISLLSEQLAEEAIVQEKLQEIIDDYRAQLDAVELPPYSGEGIVNEMLRLMTSSLLNLSIVIISPIFLLLLIFSVISRLRSKRQLEEQEQELAESTAILMEETGQFDTLLTEDFTEEEQELDFTAETEVEKPESVDIDELTIPDEIQKIDPVDVVELTEDDELITSEDDLFGIGALTEDEELISSVDLDDDDELITNEDDPFGIGALTEGEASSINLDDDDELITSEDDPFGIGALVESEASTSSIDLEENKEISKEEQADLDLAAEWEAQVAAESSDDSVKGDGVVVEEDTEVDLTTAPNEVDVQEESSALDIDLLETADSNEVDELDLSEIDPQEQAPALDVDASETADELQIGELDLSDVEPQEQTPSLDVDALETVDSGDLNKAEVSEVDELDLSELEFQEDIPSLDIDALETTDESGSEGNEVGELDLNELEFQEDISSLDIDALETADESESDKPLDTELDNLDLNELEFQEDTPFLDIDALETADESESDKPSDTEVDELDLSELEFQEDTPSLDIDALETTDESELDKPSDTEVEELDLSELDLQDDDSSLDIDATAVVEENEVAKLNVDQDLLAKQLSDVAFNEKVPLPEVDNAAPDEFIDIETLLEDSGSKEKDEPYSELELDLGLDEFPDVVDLQESVDIDDDENGIGAQLDLARAYLEIDDQAGAKDILMSVVEDSNGKQRVEIDKLLSRLK